MVGLYPGGLQFAATADNLPIKGGLEPFRLHIRLTASRPVENEAADDRLLGLYHGLASSVGGRMSFKVAPSGISGRASSSGSGQ